MTCQAMTVTLFNAVRTLAFTATLLGSVGLAQAQTPEFEKLNKAVNDSAALSVRVFSQLHSYDRVLQMRLARGALDGAQMMAMLRQRAEDLAKRSVTDATQRSEEQQEAKLFFDAIERATASARWPSQQKPEYYRAWAAVVLERVRPQHAAALANDGNAAQPLEDAYRVLLLTQGREEAGPTPFAIPSSRITTVMDMPNSSEIPPATVPPSRREFGMRRAGQDVAVLELATSDSAECQRACESNASCRAFSFKFPDDEGQKAVCSLKGSVAPPEADACCVSWVKDATWAVPMPIRR